MDFSTTSSVMYMPRRFQRAILLAASATMALTFIARFKGKRSVQAPADPAVIKSRCYVLHSSIPKEDRPYLVYLPASYSDRRYLPKSYPVLYLLDGDANLYWASGIVKFLSENGTISTNSCCFARESACAEPISDYWNDLRPSSPNRRVHSPKYSLFRLWPRRAESSPASGQPHKYLALSQPRA